jgi:hypothetical protein
MLSNGRQPFARCGRGLGLRATAQSARCQPLAGRLHRRLDSMRKGSQKSSPHFALRGGSSERDREGQRRSLREERRWRKRINRVRGPEDCSPPRSVSIGLATEVTA